MGIYDVFCALNRSNRLLRNAPATAGEIRAMEKSILTAFPSEYSDWLMLSDGGEICPPGLQLYGVSSRNLIKEELLTFQNRLAFRSDVLHLPVDLLIIGKLCFGDYICVDRKSGERVVQWSVEDEQIFLTWSSFSVYLESEWLLSEEE